PPHVSALSLHDALPILPGLFARAALRRGVRGRALPNRGFSSTATVDPDHLSRYRRLCKFKDDGRLPPTYPHLLAFALQMRLLTEDRKSTRLNSSHVKIS